MSPANPSKRRRRPHAPRHRKARARRRERAPELVHRGRGWAGKVVDKGLGHATAVLAVGALVLYGVGLVRTALQLRMEHVNAVRGLPLAPLQSYFLEGLAMFINGDAFVTVIAIVFLIVLPFLWTGPHPAPDGAPEAEKSSAPEADATADGGSKSIGWWLGWTVFGAFALLAVGQAVFTPVLRWLLPLTAAIPIAWLVFLFWRGKIPSDEKQWQRGHVATISFLLLSALGLYIAVPGYVDPPPMDHAIVATTHRQHLEGVLIAQSNGFSYLVPDGQGPGEATILALPTDEVRTMLVIKGRHRSSGTIAELLHVPSTWIDDLQGLPLIG